MYERRIYTIKASQLFGHYKDTGIYKMKWIQSCFKSKSKVKLQEDPVIVPVQIQIVTPVKKRKKAIPKKLATDIWNLYIGVEIGLATCLVCRLNPITQRDFECGHIIAESKGGSTCINNLVPICNKCNKSIATRDMREYMNEYGYGELPKMKYNVSYK